MSTSTQSPIDLDAARRAFTPKADAAEVRRNFEYDLRRFLEHSSTETLNDDPTALASYLTSISHSLEKGLTMEVPRAGFGAYKFPPVIAAIRALEARGSAETATRAARGNIAAYVRYHDERGLALPEELDGPLRAFVEESDGQTFVGGSVPLTRERVRRATDFDYEEFVRSRYSVRHFTGDPVDPAAVERAVLLAMKTPRTCNRESRRVRTAFEPDLRDHLLRFHQGNRGFGHRLGAVLLVTVDLREFDMVGERNQGWIDGGLFAMSLVYALHAAGLGTCMLNWSEDMENDTRLRAEFDIPDHEVVITLVGVGQLPDEFDVAASPSPDLGAVLRPLRLR